MKKIYTILSIIFTFSFSYAQVGIGTTSPTADLHIKSNEEFIFNLLDGVGETDDVNKNYVLETNDTRGTVKKRMDPAFNEVEFALLSGLGPQYSEFKLTNLTQTDNYTYETGWEAINGSRIILPYGRWAIYITSLASLKDVNTISNYHSSTTVTINIKMAEYNTSLPRSQTPADVEGNTLNSTNGEGQASGTIMFPNPNGIIRGVIIIDNNDPGRREKAYNFATKAIVNVRGSETLSNLQNLNIVGLLHRSVPQNQIFAIPLHK